jgi:hypothetical protein
MKYQTRHAVPVPSKSTVLNGATLSIAGKLSSKRFEPVPNGAQIERQICEVRLKIASSTVNHAAQRDATGIGTNVNRDGRGPQ